MQTLYQKIFSTQTRYWINQDINNLYYFFSQRIRLKNPSKIKQNARFLNIGCSDKGIKSEDWYNIDAFPAEGVDFVCDATRKLPFPNERFEGIYSEHFFEHIIPDKAKYFLSQCRRVLVPGGILRLSLPDGELYLKNYFENREWMLARRYAKYRTPMEVVNEVFRQGFEHQYCYDYETLSLWLKEAGFVNITRADLGVGSRSELLVDQEWRRFESLYVEAQRPPKQPEKQS